MSHPWREQFLKMMTASNADQENLAPEVIKGKKQFIAGATSVRQPLKDNTNCNSSSKDVRPVVDRKEPSTLEADSLYIAPSQCSIAAHEEIELDSEGFVIWEDSTQHSSSPEDEVRVLREALSATLEENRMVSNQAICSPYLIFF